MERALSVIQYLKTAKYDYEETLSLDYKQNLIAVAGSTFAQLVRDVHSNHLTSLVRLLSKEKVDQGELQKNDVPSKLTAGLIIAIHEVAEKKNTAGDSFLKKLNDAYGKIEKNFKAQYNFFDSSLAHHDCIEKCKKDCVNMCKTLEVWLGWPGDKPSLTFTKEVGLKDMHGDRATKTVEVELKSRKAKKYTSKLDELIGMFNYDQSPLIIWKLEYCKEQVEKSKGA